VKKMNNLASFGKKSLRGKYKKKPDTYRKVK